MLKSGFISKGIWLKEEKWNGGGSSTALGSLLFRQQFYR